MPLTQHLWEGWKVREFEGQLRLEMGFPPLVFCLYRDAGLFCYRMRVKPLGSVSER